LRHINQQHQQQHHYHYQQQHHHYQPRHQQQQQHYQSRRQQRYQRRQHHYKIKNQFQQQTTCNVICRPPFYANVKDYKNGHFRMIPAFCYKNNKNQNKLPLQHHHSGTITAATRLTPSRSQDYNNDYYHQNDVSVRYHLP
jgi:hypothetical protein